MKGKHMSCSESCTADTCPRAEAARIVSRDVAAHAQSLAVLRALVEAHRCYPNSRDCEQDIRVRAAVATLKRVGAEPLKGHGMILDGRVTDEFPQHTCTQHPKGCELFTDAIDALEALAGTHRCYPPRPGVCADDAIVRRAREVIKKARGEVAR